MGVEEEKEEAEKEEVEGSEAEAISPEVLADSNLTWLPLYDLKPQTLDTSQPELKEAGYETCWDVTEKGIGYNLELAKFCKDVTDYELQCAGEDLEGLPTAKATKKETEEVEGDRRLEVEEEKEEA